MRQKLIKVAFVAAIAFVSGVTVFNSQKSEFELSDIALANVEALADGEVEVTCVRDLGDTCLLGSTPVKDWDEKTTWW